MIVLGLLLAAASAAFVGLLIAYNTSGGPEYTVTIFDRDLVTLDMLAIFATGLALALIFCLGLAMAAAGPRRRARHNRRETDAELSARASRHASGGEWQADPAAHPESAETVSGPPPSMPPRDSGAPPPSSDNR